MGKTEVPCRKCGDILMLFPSMKKMRCMTCGYIAEIPPDIAMQQREYGRVIR